MAHQVICLYCKKKFDTDIEPFIKPNSTRYAHVECHEQATAAKTQEDKDREALEAYIKQLFNIEVLDAKIRRQIKQYITEYNYSYSGILATLKYAFEVKHNSVEKANGGIGIVGYLYQEAFRYNYNIWLSQQKNEDKVIDEYKPKEIKIIIPIPERRPMIKKKFSFLDEEVEDEQ